MRLKCLEFLIGWTTQWKILHLFIFSSVALLSKLDTYPAWWLSVLLKVDLNLTAWIEKIIIIVLLSKCFRLIYFLSKEGRTTEVWKIHQLKKLYSLRVRNGYESKKANHINGSLLVKCYINNCNSSFFQIVIEIGVFV